jgi:aspartate/methionine/tyrosine aminotransferase
MTTREKILELVADMEQTDNELTDKLLSLYSVSKRFNLPNFFVGVLVGLTLGLVILHFTL